MIVIVFIILGRKDKGKKKRRKNIAFCFVGSFVAAWKEGGCVFVGVPIWIWVCRRCDRLQVVSLEISLQFQTRPHS